MSGEFLHKSIFNDRTGGLIRSAEYQQFKGMRLTDQKSDHDINYCRSVNMYFNVMNTGCQKGKRK